MYHSRDPDMVREMWHEPHGKWVEPAGKCSGCRNLYPHVPVNCEGCEILEKWWDEQEREQGRGG